MRLSSGVSWEAHTQKCTRTRFLHSRSHGLFAGLGDPHPPSTLLTQNLPLLDTFGVQNNWNGGKYYWVLIEFVWYDTCRRIFQCENDWSKLDHPSLTIYVPCMLSLITLGWISAFQKNYIQNWNAGIWFLARKNSQQTTRFHSCEFPV